MQRISGWGGQGKQKMKQLYSFSRVLVTNYSWPLNRMDLNYKALLTYRLCFSTHTTVFMICGWLTLWMWYPWIWRADWEIRASIDFGICRGILEEPFLHGYWTCVQKTEWIEQQKLSFSQSWKLVWDQVWNQGVNSIGSFSGLWGCNLFRHLSWPCRCLSSPFCPFISSSLYACLPVFKFPLLISHIELGPTLITSS